MHQLVNNMKLLIFIFLIIYSTGNAEQKIFLNGSIPSEISFVDNYLVFVEDEPKLLESDIVRLYEQYQIHIKNGDVDAVIRMFASGDKYAKSLNSVENKARWVEIASRVKSNKILGFMIDAKSRKPVEILYLMEKYETGRSVASFSVTYINGEMKVVSNTLRANSPKYLLRDWWSKNYPGRPVLVNSFVNNVGNTPKAVDTSNNRLILLTGAGAILLLLTFLLKCWKNK